jgi:hypothetical protein
VPKHAQRCTLKSIQILSLPIGLARLPGARRMRALRIRSRFMVGSCFVAVTTAAAVVVADGVAVELDTTSDCFILCSAQELLTMSRHV